MTPKGVSPNRNSRKTKFARRFICALSQMRNPRPVSSSIDEDVRTRCHKIKIAAYLSMARAVGSRRVWSRALLFKLRTRARRHNMTRRRPLGLKQKRVIKNDPQGELSQTKKLRHLVPGGKTMDMCSLLEETAHYITCLATQVKVMQNIADHFSKWAGHINTFLHVEDKKVVSFIYIMSDKYVKHRWYIGYIIGLTRTYAQIYMILNDTH